MIHKQLSKYWYLSVWLMCYTPHRMPLITFKWIINESSVTIKALPPLALKNLIFANENHGRDKNTIGMRGFIICLSINFLWQFCIALMWWFPNSLLVISLFSCPSHLLLSICLCAHMEDKKCLAQMVVIQPQLDVLLLKNGNKLFNSSKLIGEFFFL